VTDTPGAYLGGDAQTAAEPHADDPHAAEPAHPGYTGSKDAQLKRLRRIEGQIRGLQRMVDEDQYCIDVLTQVAAATKALQSFSLGLIEEHLAHCVVDAARKGGPEGQAKVKEASDAIARLIRS
jgi:DNA-binding FrmR family transcriptional regulator